MKKLLIVCLLISVAITAQAQVVTFTLNTQPCNNNGVVTANLPSNLSFPITVTWYSGSGTLAVHTVSALTDVLNNWSGNFVYVYAVGANNQAAAGGYASPPFNITTIETPAVCPALGSSTATVTGGTPPYTYQWTDYTTQVVVSTSNPANLPSGFYDLTVTDANNCVSKIDSGLYIKSNSSFAVTVTTQSANCTNGSATVGNITGGTPPYSYLWSNNATTTSISGLSMGSYEVDVTDANGCVAKGYGYVQQTINIGTNVTTTPTTCIQTNGAISAFGSGGTPPYTYLWNNNATTQTQSNIPGGSYNVKVTDANGCIGTGYGYVNSSTPINVTRTAVPSACTTANGSATVSISGGTPPYVVTWNTFPAQTGTTLSNIAPGTYSFHVSDAAGCVRTGAVIVPPVNVITGTFSALQPSCTAANGTLGFTPSGGLAPYTYLWSNSATTQTVTSLSAGSHSVTVTDDAGCAITKSYSLVSSSPVHLGLSTTPATCIFNSDGIITANPTGGTAPYSYSWNGIPSSNNVHSNLKTGNYYVYVTDANGCTDAAMTFVPYNASNTSCYCTITGTVYNDANANCVKDAGEAGIPNIQIHCSSIGYAYTNAQGIYSFKVPTGSYTISETVLAYYPLAACQNNSIAANVTASTGCTQTVNFANTAATIHSMSVSTWKNNCPVPGFSHNMTTIITNQGTVTENGIVAGKQSDIQIGAASITPSGVYNAGGAGYYNLAGGNLSLPPGTSASFGMNYMVPTNIPVNTSLVFKDSVAHTGPISNWMNDYSPWNNVKTYSSMVVSSYDPNFKEVYPAGVGPTGLITPADTVLEYMVHFQNLGNYHATNVVVLDTLDANLDWTTMRPLYQSHPGVVTLSEGGVATFTFNNINLPAKMYDEEGSNGMFTFSIRTKKNLPLGTQWKNTAAIYFDFNEPVITNTTVNTLHDPQSVRNISGNNGSLTIYPNPASKEVYVQLDAQSANTKADIRVVDISGKALISKTVSLNAGVQTMQVGVGTLTPGIYFINVTGSGRNQTEKLVILK